MRGIIAAVPTPVDSNLTFQSAPYLEHAKWALANGCDGLNILGSTGEANSFDSATRKTVMACAAGELDRARLMVGTATPSLAETIAMTGHADDLGYSVALVLPPYYYKPVSETGLYNWYRTLHEALGARKIAIYFYNYPQMTGIVIPVSVIARLAVDFPDRFRGIKDSSGDLDYCRAIVAANSGLAVFPSSETALGVARADGFAGCISATVNASAPLCARFWSGKETSPGTAERIAGIRSDIAAQPLIPAVKHMVARRSGDPIWANVVPPFAPLTADGRAALDRIDPGA
ncbi:MAG: dihydrodipicolinate synthase family protein [Pseudorhodobacter sp.]